MVTLVATVVVMGTGAVIDVLTRRIPNALTVPAAAAGVALAAAGVSHVTVPQSLAGLVLGMLLMLPGYLLGATGAGDVKLLGAAGALLGVALVPVAFVYTAIAGGAFAVVIAFRRGRLAATVGGLRLATHGRHALSGDRFFPYGPAIAVGCVLAAL